MHYDCLLSPTKDLHKRGNVPTFYTLSTSLTPGTKYTRGVSLTVFDRQGLATWEMYGMYDDSSPTP